MIEIENRTDCTDLPLDIIEQITRNLTNKIIELIFVGNEEMRQINKTFRKIDKPTDVLSFPLEQAPGSPLGSIVINIDKAQKIADHLGHTLQEEIILLYIHGLLHLFGYDHETDNGEMRQKEAELIKTYNLPQSLLVRNEE